MASLGWIDFSREHRDRIGSVLDMLKAEGMVDELGLGTLRDAMANELFPGISTIQTRARYFFIIPYILYEYQSLKPTQRRGKNISRFLEQREYEVMWQLAEHYNYQERNGVIGITKRRPQKIARRPSAIYWNGLYTYRFIDTNGLPSETYLKQVTNPSLESLLADTPSGDDQQDDRDAAYENEFRIQVPPNLDWQQNPTLDLDRSEAEFFRDRIITLGKGRLIAELIKENALWEIFSAASGFMDFAKAALTLPLKEEIKKVLVLAHDFSELMYGVHLAYNCQLQNRVFQNKHWDEEWKEWKKRLTSEMINYQNFAPQLVFEYSASTRETTKTFIRNWWAEAQNGFKDSNLRDQLILHQEALVKRGKARLQWKKTEDIKPEQWVGLNYFDYRFNQVRTIINDIRTGLER